MVYTIDEIKDKIIPIAKQYNLSKVYLFGSYARKVYLFGSYARGEEDENSDIDIVIRIEDESQYMDVYGILSRVFNCDVDILLVNDLLNPRTNIGTLVKKNFLHDRVLIYQ
ncbi:nucleotidyltransferase domain-containing protein [Streptococcus anginosus]|nr:nucleotidyltransferase domain-containing protein [Streptococcus anginosus]